MVEEADFGFVFDGDAAALGADDFAEEAIIDGAEDFDGDDVEEVGGIRRRRVRR